MWKTWITSNAFQIRESKYRSHGRYLICIGFSFSFLCFSTFSSSFQVVLDLKKKSLCPLPKFPTIYSWGSKSTKNNEMLLGLQLLSMLSREPASVGKATPSKWMPETSLTLTFASVHQKNIVPPPLAMVPVALVSHFSWPRTLGWGFLYPEILWGSIMFSKHLNLIVSLREAPSFLKWGWVQGSLIFCIGTGDFLRSGCGRKLFFLQHQTMPKRVRAHCRPWKIFLSHPAIQLLWRITFLIDMHILNFLPLFICGDRNFLSRP